MSSTPPDNPFLVALLRLAAVTILWVAAVTLLALIGGRISW